jgi:3-oxoacyl-(acyl-carrier-protein) synthase
MPFVAAHRVAITGIGVISAIGLDRHQFWASLAEGKSGIGEFEQPEYGPDSLQERRLRPRLQARELLSRQNRQPSWTVSPSSP